MCVCVYAVYRIFVSQGRQCKTAFRFNFRVHNSLVAILHSSRDAPKERGLRIEMIVGWLQAQQGLQGCCGCVFACVCVCVFARSRPAYWQHWQPLAHRRNFATCSPKFSLPVFALSNSRAAQVVFPSRFMHSAATAFATAAGSGAAPAHTRTPLRVTAAVAAVSGIKWVFAIRNGCKFSGLLTHSK